MQCFRYQTCCIQLSAKKHVPHVILHWRAGINLSESYGVLMRIPDRVCYPQALKIRQNVRISDSMKPFHSINNRNNVNGSKVDFQRGVGTKNNVT